MASQIDPDPTRKASEPARKASEPAAKPPATPGPAARKPVPPAPPTPQAPPRPAVPTARPAPGQRPAAQRPDEQDEEEPAASPFASGWLSAVPAWAVSMLFHVVVLLAMALIAGETVDLVKPTVITSSPTEEEEEFSEFEEEKPDVPIEESTDDVADVVVTADVAVEPVEVVSLADDIDAAPLAVELTEFGDSTAPASDIMSTIGAVGGTGGGLGGRANHGKLARGGGGGGDTENAVDRALKWLAAHQLPDGSWSFDLAKCPSCAGKCSHSGIRDDRCAATAMALLPFLGRGYTHREGPYAKQVGAGIAVLADMAMKGNGKAYDGNGSMYSQGLAGIALSECYAMSQDNRLAQPTQYVLDYIMEAQDPVGGGWRYGPKQPGDTSAVGWQIMALKSGNMAYLNVNPLTIKKAIEFLDSVQGDDYGSTYGYTGPGQGAGTTAVGLLCRMYLGWKKEHQGLQEGAARLAKMGPTSDLYYSYYGTQVMHHLEGEMWMAWNKQMKALLLPNQSNKDHESGSWYDAVDGGHGAHVAGRLYCTSLATMMLEVYYRHLPIFRETSVQDEFRE